ncbi:MAG: hypothetical protein M3P22_00685 [bacterium]|nr:hypothetical protein [bacterium]
MKNKKIIKTFLILSLIFVFVFTSNVYASEVTGNLSSASGSTSTQSSGDSTTSGTLSSNSTSLTSTDSSSNNGIIAGNVSGGTSGGTGGGGSGGSSLLASTVIPNTYTQNSRNSGIVLGSNDTSNDVIHSMPESIMEDSNTLAINTTQDDSSIQTANTIESSTGFSLINWFWLLLFLLLLLLIVKYLYDLEKDNRNKISNSR